MGIPTEGETLDYERLPTILDTMAIGSFVTPHDEEHLSYS